MKTRYLIISVLTALALVAVVFMILEGRMTSALAAVKAPVAELHVCLDGPPTCDYNSVREAVATASEDDVIKVAAGVYRGTRALLNIDKSIMLQGGYTTADWNTPDPEANPTTLDVQGFKQPVITVVGGKPTIEGFRITGGDAGSLGGGGVSVVNASIVLRGNWVFSNTAALGGGIYLRSSGDAILSDNVIISNTAKNGAGLFLNEATAMLSRNIISANVAITRGGGLVLFRSGQAVVDGNTIAENLAGDGGGVYLDSSDTTVDGNDLVANTANRGGGMYLEDSGAVLLNNTIYENNVGTAGSGVYIFGSSPRLLHNTLVDNSGSDAVHVAGSANAKLINTIIATHTLGVNVAAGSIASLDATLWYGNADDWDGAGKVNISPRDYTGDPAFVAPSKGDYHIKNVSIALDAGVNMGIGADMDGEQRPRGSGYDIGADEFPDVLSVIKEARTRPVWPGETLIYDIQITNFGSITFTANITDSLPENVTPTGIITWVSQMLPPGEAWEGQVIVSVNEDYWGVLLNTVDVTTEEGEIGAGSLSITSQPVYMPLALRRG